MAKRFKTGIEVLSHIRRLRYSYARLFPRTDECKLFAIIPRELEREVMLEITHLHAARTDVRSTAVQFEGVELIFSAQAAAVSVTIELTREYDSGVKAISNEIWR